VARPRPARVPDGRAQAQHLVYDDMGAMPVAPPALPAMLPRAADTAACTGSAYSLHPRDFVLEALYI
jgi:hypothetical protein